MYNCKKHFFLYFLCSETINSMNMSAKLHLSTKGGVGRIFFQLYCFAEAFLSKLKVQSSRVVMTVTGVVTRGIWQRE